MIENKKKGTTMNTKEKMTAYYKMIMPAGRAYAAAIDNDLPADQIAAALAAYLEAESAALAAHGW